VSLIAQAIHEARAGTLDNGRVSSLTSLAGAFLKALHESDFEKRLAELEQARAASENQKRTGA
jgi:hypothetical protein